LWAALRGSARLSRSLAVMAGTVRRLRDGDLHARTRVRVAAELETLADDVNALADSLLARAAQAPAPAPTAAGLAPRPDLEAVADERVATVAHELKTPLTSLHMALHLCAEGVAGPLTDKQADLIAASREDCERIRAIVDDLLDLARLHSGRDELQREALDPRALVEAVVERHQPAAARRDVTLKPETLPGLPSVWADRDRATIALSNLVGNAVRHAPDCGIVVVACHADDGSVRFDVADTGAGIAPKHQPRVFERFFRVPGGGSQGSGLGLAIAKEIVEAHGGAIGVESVPGRGSRFWLKLPVGA
jgi:signal transduction histidine kinase